MVSQDGDTMYAQEATWSAANETATNHRTAVDHTRNQEVGDINEAVACVSQTKTVVCHKQKRGRAVFEMR